MRNFAFIIWLLITLLLTVSVIGIILMAMPLGDYEHPEQPSQKRSFWFEIGNKLLDTK